LITGTQERGKYVTTVIVKEPKLRDSDMAKEYRNRSEEGVKKKRKLWGGSDMTPGSHDRAGK